MVASALHLTSCIDSYVFSVTTFMISWAMQRHASLDSVGQEMEPEQRWGNLACQTEAAQAEQGLLTGFTVGDNISRLWS